VVGTSGIAVWAEGIKADLQQRLPGQRKTQRDKLSLLVATMLHVRSANLVELASGRRGSESALFGLQVAWKPPACDGRILDTRLFVVGGG